MVTITTTTQRENDLFLRLTEKNEQLAAIAREREDLRQEVARLQGDLEKLKEANHNK